MLEIDLHVADRLRIEPLLRVSDLLLEQGARFVDRGLDPPDLRSKRALFIEHTLLSREVREQRYPIYVLERADAAICWDRTSAMHPNVVRVFKLGVLSPQELHNACRGRYHSTLIDHGLCRPPSKRLNDEHLAKLTPFYNYAVYTRLQSWRDVALKADRRRQYQLNFAGTVEYGPRVPEITAHRRAAIREIAKIPGSHIIREGRPLRLADYRAALLDSQICVSPWGLGEICHRDVEAMLAGCVLIKPDSSFVSTWPPLFRNGESYIPCRADFSNLSERTTEVLDRWRELLDMREQNRAMLIEAMQTEVLAQRISDLITSAAANSPPRTREEVPMNSEIKEEPTAMTTARLKSYGDAHYTACPMCESESIQAIWKIPFARLAEKLPLSIGTVQYLPTFGATTIYEYSRCDTCQSVFLNPYKQARKDEYASRDNPGAATKIAEATSIDHPSWKKYRARFESHLRPYMPKHGELLIDAACGGGQYLLLARDEDEVHFDRSLGLELSPLAVEHLRSQGIAAEACDLDTDTCRDIVPDGSADFVIFSEAFEHVISPFACLRRLVNMLKPGGRLFFSAQRMDPELPIRPGENHCLSKQGLDLIISRLNCAPVSVHERPGKWLVVLEKR